VRVAVDVAMALQGRWLAVVVAMTMEDGGGATAVA